MQEKTLPAVHSVQRAGVESWKSGQRSEHLLGGRSVQTSDSADREDFCHGIAADAVRTVNAASDLTRRIEMRNRLAIAIDDFGLRRDGKTTHGVMHSHRETSGKERCLFDLLNKHGRLAAEGILLRFDGLVVFGDGSLEVFGGHLKLERQIVKRIGLHRVASRICTVKGFLGTSLHGVVAVHIADAENNLRGRAQNGVGNDVSTLVFTHEAVTVLVDENDTLDWTHHADESTIGGGAWQKLDEVHAYHFGTNVLSRRDQVTRGALVVRGRKVKETRIVKSTNVRICRKAAGRDNDPLFSLEELRLAALVDDFNADHGALQRLFADEADDLGFKRDGYIEFFALADKRINEPRPEGLHGIVSTGIETAVDLIDARREFNADDFTGFQAAMGELLHRGYDPVSFFADVDMFGNTSKTAQASVVDKVIGGQADAGIVRTCFLEDLAGLRKTELPVRVIEPYDDPNFACRRSTALYPNWTISSVPTLTAEELRRVMELLFAMPPTSNGMFWSVAPSFSATDNLMKELKIGPYDFLRHWTIERLWTEYRTLAGSNHPSNADNDGEAQKPQPIDASAGHRNIENNVAVPNEVCLC